MEPFWQSCTRADKFHTLVARAQREGRAHYICASCVCVMKIRHLSVYRFSRNKKVRYYFHHNFLRPSCNEQNIPGELLEGHGCNGYATTSLHNTSEALCSYVRTPPEGDLRNSPNAGEHSRAGRPESIVIMVVNLIKIFSQPRVHMYVCVCAW